MRRADHAADLVAPLNFVIDLGKDIRGGAVASAIGFLEKLPPAFVESLVGPEQPRCRYLLADCAGDAPSRVEESIVRLAAMGSEPAVETLADSVNGTEQNPAFAEDVRLVLEF